MTRKRIPLEFFLAGADTDVGADFAGDGVLETVVEPRVGTGGITILVASTLDEVFLADVLFAGAFFAEDFFAGRLAAAFFGGRFVALADFFTAFFAGRFAAAFFAGRFAAFFFAATTTPLVSPLSILKHEDHAKHDLGMAKAYLRPQESQRYRAPIKGAIFGAIARKALPRWLIASLVSGSICAVVISKPFGWKIGS